MARDDLAGQRPMSSTFEGTTALGEKLTWEAANSCPRSAEMPIKCPVAPLEFTFLADAFFGGEGDAGQGRDHLCDATGGRSRKPVASKYLGDMLDDRQKIHLEPDFMIESGRRGQQGDLLR